MLCSNTTKIATIMTKKNQIKLELDKKKNTFILSAFVQKIHISQKKKVLDDTRHVIKMNGTD